MSYQVVSDEHVPVAVVQHERHTDTTSSSVDPVLVLQKADHQVDCPRIRNVAGDDDDTVVVGHQEQGFVEYHRVQSSLVNGEIKLCTSLAM